MYVLEQTRALPQTPLIAAHNVIPVHKGNSKENVEHHGPVSLMSVVSKIAERCVFNHIYLQLANVLNTPQYGFTCGKSTTTQLVEFIEDVGRTLDQTGQTDVIYPDFSKAFDSVSDSLLLVKLQEIGMSDNLLK